MNKTYLSRAVAMAFTDTSNARMEAPVRGTTAKNYIAADGTLMIYGIIGDWWDELDAASVIQQLTLVSGPAVKVRIHSNGGSVVEGLAIYNALRNCGKPVEVTIDGIAASIATVVALAGDVRRMPKNSYQFVHQAWDYVEGNADDLRKAADDLEMWTSEVADIYASRTNLSADEWKALMKAEAWLTAADCLANGMATEIIGEVTAVAHHDFDATTMPAGAAALMQLPEVTEPVPEPNTESDLPPDAAPAADNSDEEDPMKMQAPAGAPNPAPQDPAAPAAPATPVPGADAQAAISAERVRVKELRGIAAQAKLTDSALNDWIDNGTDIATARAEALAAVAERDKGTVPSGRVRVSNGGNAQLRTDMAAAMRARAGTGDRVANDFAGMTLIEMSRMALQYGGVSTNGLSHDQIAQMAISTSDLPNILADVASNELAAGFTAVQRTFTGFCRRTNLTNFKEKQLSKLSSSPELKDKLENGEYEFGALADSAEKIKLATKGRLIAISRETLINDDMDALSRVPQILGSAAARAEVKAIYSILAKSQALAETGKNLFHGDHKNIGAAGAISVDTLAKAREMMRLQTTFAPKGETGDAMNLAPKFLIVPAKRELEAQQVLAAITAAKSGDVNPFINSMNLVVEAELDNLGVTGWFAAADPMLIDTIVYGYLDGQEGAYIDSMIDFKSDAMILKVRHDFAAAAADFRGLHKNAGA